MTSSQNQCLGSESKKKPTNIKNLGSPKKIKIPRYPGSNLGSATEELRNYQVIIDNYVKVTIIIKIIKCCTGTNYRCGFKHSEIKENESKRNSSKFLKLQIIPEHSTKQVFTLNTGTPIENQIVIRKFNKVWELSNPEKKKTDPDTS